MFEIFAAMSIRIQVDITALLIAAIASPLIALPTTEVDKKSYMFGIKTYFSGTLYANLLQCRLVNGRKAHFGYLVAQRTALEPFGRQSCKKSDHLRDIKSFECCINPDLANGQNGHTFE